jgi:hypothetical protein
MSEVEMLAEQDELKFLHESADTNFQDMDEQETARFRL